MRRISTFLIILLILCFVWNKYGNDIKDSNYIALYENMKLDINSLRDRPEVSAALDTLQIGINDMLGQLNQAREFFPNGQQQPKLELDQGNKPDLEAPLANAFSVNNIELGDSKEDAEKQTGKAKRSTYNEYGVKWYAYHENYQNFFMAAYDESGKVAGLYTNQDLIASKLGIKLGSKKDDVLKQLGEPETKIQKGFIFYKLQNNDEYSLFQMDDSYVTFFYDKHKNNTVTALQIISEKLEQQKKHFYTEASQALKEGFEFQLFDLTNAARVEHGLHPLSWDDPVKETARDHSADMAKNHYFDHTNLEGKSPFDRMKEDEITFRAAGENLAFGQLSSVFAHEGLMNSLGHRENILQTDFESLGVGVAFDAESRPYYTENFLTK